MRIRGDLRCAYAAAAGDGRCGGNKPEAQKKAPTPGGGVGAKRLTRWHWEGTSAAGGVIG